MPRWLRKFQKETWRKDLGWVEVREMKEVRAWVYFSRPRHSLQKTQSQHQWIELMPANIFHKIDIGTENKCNLKKTKSNSRHPTWNPAAFSKVAILCTNPKAENTWDKFQSCLITFYNDYKKENQTIHHSGPSQALTKMRQRNQISKYLRNKCRMTPVHVCVKTDLRKEYDVW